jgi:alkanesulfonate monooxygenase SsuD/methylene tetrahydromethanopterin reductase-like flavin-dependent oxidoreductase (luciferase family)
VSGDPVPRPFRFGVVAGPLGPGEEWLAAVRRTAALGYTTLLSPDGVGLHAPFAALGMAAGAVPGLRVGTFVLAAPLRSPQQAAWEGHSLAELSGGRFEFGIGTGRPDARAGTEALGRTWGTGADRLAAVRATIAALRGLDGPGRRTPVVVAAAGPGARALAASEADVVALAARPLTPRGEVVAMAADVRERAGRRDVELMMNLVVVGDEVPPWTRRVIGADPAELFRRNALGALRGTPQQMADELRRRRDEVGVTYYAVDRSLADALAPVVALLAGG